MDHIPGLRLNPVTVRLLSADNYEGGDFAQYPDVKLGLKTVREWNRLFATRDPALCRFLETWTYFGYLSTVLKAEVPVTTFIRQSTNSSDQLTFILNTSKLPSYLQNLMSRYDLENGKDLSLLVKNLLYGVHLHRALRGLNNGNPERGHELETQESLLQYLNNSRIPEDIRTPEFALATSILVETIGSAITAKQINLSAIVLRGSERWTSYIWALLKEKGWCPRDLTSHFGHLNTTALYFLLGIQPRPHIQHPVHQIHDANFGDADQDTCSAFRCAKMTIDHKNYETVHTTTCQGSMCPEIAADSASLYAILTAKKIPLIYCVQDEVAGIKICFEAKEKSHRYIAISHVWSDGLGNLQANSVPRCQLFRLCRLIRRLPSNYKGITRFWFDTICIPPDSLGQRECQENAIARMREVYDSASTVLILDSWLMTDASVEMSDYELGLRIISSTWNTRLWTFQEVALANDPHFQLSNGAYSLDQGKSRLDGEASFAATITLRPVVKDYHFTVREFQSRDMVQRFIAISAVLTDRTTSQVTDEAICIAVLLGLDSGEVAHEPETPPDSRMKKLWRMVPTVPDALISCDLETFDEDGLRWAPKSFLRSAWAASLSPHGTPDTNRIGTLNSARGISVLSIGVHLRSCGLLIPAPDASLSGIIYVLVEESWKILQISGRINNDAEGFNLDNNGTPRSYAINPHSKYNAKWMAFVRDEIDDQFRFGEDPTKTSRESGCLVVITELRPKQLGGILFTKRICSADLYKVPDHDITQIRFLEHRRREANMKFGQGYVQRDIHGKSVLSCIAGQRTEPLQQWIIY